MRIGRRTKPAIIPEQCGLQKLLGLFPCVCEGLCYLTVPCTTNLCSQGTLTSVASVKLEDMFICLPGTCIFSVPSAMRKHLGRM